VSIAHLASNPINHTLHIHLLLTKAHHLSVLTSVINGRKILFIPHPVQVGKVDICIHILELFLYNISLQFSTVMYPLLLNIVNI